MLREWGSPFFTGISEFDYFHPMTGDINRYGSMTNLSPIIDQFRKVVSNWSDGKVHEVVAYFLNAFDDYLVSQARELNDQIQLWNDHRWGDGLSDTCVFEIFGCLYEWSIEEEADSVLLMDLIEDDEKEIISHILTNANHEIRKKELSKYTDKELIACLALSAVAKVVADLSISETNQNYYYIDIIQNMCRFSYLQMLFNVVDCDEKKPVVDRTAIARSGGNAKAKKHYKPMKAFVFEMASKNKYRSANRAGIAIAPLLEKFCREKKIPPLSKQSASHTIAKWLRSKEQNSKLFVPA